MLLLKKISFLKIPFLIHAQVFPCKISPVCRLKYPYSCFSSHFYFRVIVFLFILMFSILFLVAVINLSMFFWRGAYDKFPDFFHMGTFIDSTHEILVSFEVISSGYNALVEPFQQLLQGPMEVLLCERVNDLRHSLFHLLNCLITTASELRE